MKKIVMIGAMLVAVATFGAQAQTLPAGSNSGTGNGTNGSASQTGTTANGSGNSTTGTSSRNANSFGTTIQGVNSMSTQSDSAGRGSSKGKMRNGRKGKRSSSQSSDSSSMNGTPPRQ